MRRIFVFSSFAIVVIASGCGSRERQFEVEAQVGMRIVWALELYRAGHPNENITNLSQLAANSREGYPYGWHDRFRRFGKRAGFENSIYEKYILFSPGVRSQGVPGEVVMMNAMPFPGPEGKLRRTIVLLADGKYTERPLPESSVQQMFKEAGIPEPKPLVMLPPPPRPPELQSPGPFTKFREHFFGLLDAYGLSPHVAIPLWYSVLSLPFISVLALGFWLRRRTHSRNRT